MRHIYAITSLELRMLASAALGGGGFLLWAGLVIGFVAGGGHNGHAPLAWLLVVGALLLIGMAGLMVRDWRSTLRLMYKECATAEKQATP